MFADLELVPAFAQRHPHVGGENAIEDANNTSLRSLQMWTSCDKCCRLSRLPSVWRWWPCRRPRRCPRPWGWCRKVGKTCPGRRTAPPLPSSPSLKITIDFLTRSPYCRQLCWSSYPNISEFFQFLREEMFIAFESCLEYLYICICILYNSQPSRPNKTLPKRQIAIFYTTGPSISSTTIMALARFTGWKNGEFFLKKSRLPEFTWRFWSLGAVHILRQPKWDVRRPPLPPCQLSSAFARCPFCTTIFLFACFMALLMMNGSI